MKVCPTCFQPECPQSVGGFRSKPASHSSKLKPGEREYRGYCEWAVHPDEAIFVLHRGYALVDGERQRVLFIQNEAFVTMLMIEGSDMGYRIEDGAHEPLLGVDTAALWEEQNAAV